MADLVKFVRGESAGYTSLVTKDANTLYFLTDTYKIYLGETLIADKTTLDLTAVENAIKAVTGDLTTLTTDVKTSLVAAINEIDANADAALAKANQMVVTVEKVAAGADGITKYIVKQNDAQVGDTIDIPKDLMVTDGYYDSDTKEIVLVLNDSSSTEIRVDASDLVDTYTAKNAENADVTITVNNYEISATLSEGVKASLAKADTALQAAALEDYTKTEDLGDLATEDKADLIEELDDLYDEIGAADAVKAYAEGLLTWGSF